jgi:hypothetical protein
VPVLRVSGSVFPSLLTPARNRRSRVRHLPRCHSEPHKAGLVRLLLAWEQSPRKAQDSFLRPQEVTDCLTGTPLDTEVGRSRPAPEPRLAGSRSSTTPRLCSAALCREGGDSGTL